MSGIIKTPILKIFILLSMILIGAGKAYCVGGIIEMDTTDLRLIPKLWRITSERSSYKAPIDKTVFFQDFKGRKNSYTVVKIDSIFHASWIRPGKSRVMQIRKINIDTLKYEKKLLVYKSTTKISFYGQSNEDIRKWTTSQSFRHLGDTILSYQLETKEYSDTFNTTPYIYADSINYIYNGIRLGAVFSRRIFDKEKEEYNARYKRDPPTFSSIMMIYDYSPNGLLLSIRSRFSNDTTVQISRFEYKMPAHTQKREEPEDRNCSKKISVHFRNYVEYYFDDQYRECILWNTGPNWVQSRYNHGVGFDSHDTTTPKSYPYPSSISYFFHKGHKLEKVITTKMFSSTHIQNIAIKVYQNRKHTKEITYNFKNFLQGTSVFVNRNFQFIFDHVNIKVDKTDQQNEAFMYSLLGGFTPLPFKYNNTMKVKLSDEITKSYHKIIKGG